MSNLKNLGTLFSRSEFNNIPMEYVVPKGTKVVYVGDFLKEEISGGAELTADAIFEDAPMNVFKVHSQSLTTKFLKFNKNCYYIIGNFSMIPVESIGFLIENKIKYSIIEFDYKYCMFRSEVMHKQQTGNSCDCMLKPVGLLVESFFENADKIFWMSEAQKEHFLSRVPSLNFCDEGKHVVQSSTFSDESIEKLLLLRKQKEQNRKLPIKIWGVQGSQNWIKGTEQTIKYCNEKKYAMRVLQNMQYDDFLLELSKCDGLVFHPLDFDTCPRVVIEARLMGLDLDINDNVQIKNEAWLLGSQEDLLNFLRSRKENFWKNINI
jgi:hypothetical protein